MFPSESSECFAEYNVSNSNSLSSENFNSELFGSSIHNNSQITENKEGQGKSYIFFI